MRPTETLCTAQTLARSAAEVLDPAELGAARYTRHSFARSFLRTAAAQRWQVVREAADLDDAGRGDIVYRVDIGDRTLRFVAFCATLTDDDRTDRVVATSWDVTAALIEGPLTAERLTELRQQVPRQEQGRADDGTLIWTRANRSARFFDYVVDRLRRGLQPDPDTIGESAYVLRSTAFYSNGKFGLADFDRLNTSHPLRLPYRAHMLTAWLLRELSYDLVEHCARVRNPLAATLDDQWRRYFGLGNATGLGMVPYVINHPLVLDAWCAARELPLAHALSQGTEPTDDRVRAAASLMARAVGYFRDRAGATTAPFVASDELADELETVEKLLTEYIMHGTIAGVATDRAWKSLHSAAAALGTETRAVVDSVIVEVDDDLDLDIENLLYCEQHSTIQPTQSCGALLETVRRDYDWALRIDFDDPDEQAYFWFSSQNNEEPRRGRRGIDPGEHVEHPIDIARAVHALHADLSEFAHTRSVADFLVDFPWHRGTVARVQSLATVAYGEVRTNLLAREFLPLNLQRFQLAMYGMENYVPQSTDWLRVTLYSGAPRASDVAAGTDDDWMFFPKPRKGVDA